MSNPNELSLRHAVATLAYRGNRALRGATAEFAVFQIGSATRQPAQILAHVGDLLDWALSIVNGNATWHNSTPLPWDQEVARFFRALETLDRRLASEPLACPANKVFQGPIADALTHVGQISMLRRLAGQPAGGENFFIAEIVEGRVGPDQAKPLREFD